MAPKLNRRIQICSGEMTPNTSGGFDFSYALLTTLWAQVEPISEYIKAIRGEQADNTQLHTHRFIVRTAGITALGKSFSTAYDSGYKNMADITPLKADHFIMMQQGSTIKGLLFKIVGLQRDDVHKEYMRILALEMEEKGTGWPE